MWFTVCGHPLGYLIIRTGYVSLEDYMSFVIGHETENVESNREVESAFQSITSGGDKPYVTKEELFQVCCKHVMSWGRVQMFVCL